MFTGLILVRKTPEIRSNLKIPVEKLEISPPALEDCELVGVQDVYDLVKKENVIWYFEGIRIVSIMEIEAILRKMNLFLGMEFVE